MGKKAFLLSTGYIPDTSTIVFETNKISVELFQICT